MFTSLKNLKNNLNKDTIIMPGHNYSINRQSTLEEEINGNPFWAKFINLPRLDDWDWFKTGGNRRITEL